MIIEAYRWFFLRLADVVGLGWGIVALSFITSAAMMPLMKALAGIVKRETEYQGVILPQLAAVREKYSSDIDRNFHVQRLYARYSYSPLSAVKKVLPLFVQIPFLLLTYFMLKDTAELQGVPFLFLHNLGVPDAFAHGINLLPFVMTGVNLITVAATPGFTSRDQVQAVAIALLFLAMLYTAPSALLLYWTLNNAITMVRTLVAKRREGARLLAGRLCMAAEFVRPANLYRQVAAIPDFAWAWATLVFLVLSAYFCVTAKLMMGVMFGLNMNIMYRGMVFMIAATSIFSFILLRHESAACRVIRVLSVVLVSGFAVFFAGLYFFSRFNFIRFFEYVDLFVLAYILVAVCVCPYFVRGRKVFGSFAGDFFGTLCNGWYLLILPIVLAVHYSYSSEVFTLPVGSVLTLAVMMVFPCIAVFALVLVLFRHWISADRLFKCSVGVLVAIYIVPFFSRSEGVLGFDRNLPIRLLLMALTIALLMCIRRRAAAAVFIGIFFIAVVVGAFFHHGNDAVSQRVEDKSGDKWKGVLGDVACVKSNNVYLLVYDSYGHRSIMEGLGISDGSIYNALENNGFTVYDAYTMGADTLTSMNAAFKLGGVSGCSVNATVAGDNVFSDFVRANGYKTSYLLNGYEMPNRGERMPGDYYYPGAAEIPRPEMVLFPCIIRGTFSQSPQVFNSYTQEDWMNAYYDVMRKRPCCRSFIYAHNANPGHASWEPRYRKSDKEEQLAFKSRVEAAHAEIKDSLDLLKNDRDSIVIICSDHGGSLLIPNPPGNWDVRHLIDHYGILLAIRWPKDYKPCLKLNCLQNVFLEVLIYLTGDTSLARLEVPGETVYMPYPIGVPAGMISKGIIQSGPDKGRSLFEAAWQKYRR